MNSTQKVEDSLAPPESDSTDISVIFLEERMNHVAEQIAPSELFGGKTVNPERNLFASVLGSAFLDLQLNRTEELRRQAYYYLMSEGVFGKEEYGRWPLLVENICKVLDFDVGAIREVAYNMYHNPTDVNFKW